MADRDLKDLEQVARRVEDARGYLHIEDKTAELEKLDHPWVQEYFNGPRGRAARA